MPAFDIIVRRRNANDTGTEEVSVPYTPGNPLAFDEHGHPVSSGGVLKVATVTLTDAQIKALPTTAIVIVPNPGAGRMLQLVSGIAVMNFSGVYANTQGASPLEQDGLFLEMSDTNAVSLKTGSYWVFEDASEPTYVHFLPKTAAYEVDASQRAIVDYVSTNTAIRLKYDNQGAGVLTGGNAANTLKVTVWYVEVDV